MKKIKYLILSGIAMFLLFSFSSCVQSSEDFLNDFTTRIDKLVKDTDKEFTVDELKQLDVDITKMMEKYVDKYAEEFTKEQNDKFAEYVLGYSLFMAAAEYKYPDDNINAHYKEFGEKHPDLIK